MNIIDDVSDPLWKKIPCSCDHSSVLTEFPLKDCIHCKCEKQENSIPKNDFTVKELDENDNEITKTITEIKLYRGEKYQEVIGWLF